MKTTAIIFGCLLIPLNLLPPQPCRASFFEMTLERNSIYTPGNMNLVVKLTDQATVQGKYTFGVNVFVSETVVRKQVLPATKDEPVVFELSFPETRSRANVRCRVELLIDGQFIEAHEKPLSLWPPLAPLEKRPKDKVIWVYDTSGGLQKIFKDLQVHAADATFQAIRDFQVPDIIFIGENLGPKEFQTLEDRILCKDESLEAIVLLRQDQFPEDWPVQVVSAEKLSKNVSSDPNSPLLSGLSRLDVMNMVSSAVPVQITEPKGKEWKVDSCISEPGKDQEQTYSYLAVIKERKPTMVYCQLPITRVFSDDPRSGLLLGDLLHFVYANSVPHGN